MIEKVKKMTTLLLNNSREVSTQSTYHWYQKQFVDFAEKLNLAWDEDTALLFITRWFCKKKSFSSCRMARFAVAALYLDNGITCLKESHRMKNLLKACEKFSVIPSRSSRDPFPVMLLHSLCHNKPSSWNEQLWVMYCALISIGLRTMARGGELCCLKRSDIEFVAADKVIVTFRRTKTKTFGRKVVIKAANKTSCTVKWLHKWLEISKDSPCEWLFHSGCQQLLIQDISSCVKLVAKEFQCKGNFTSHSLRIGGATALTFAGYSKEQIQAIGGWNSDAIDRYMKVAVDIHKNISADMLL